MRIANHSMTTPSTAWRNRARSVNVVVRPVFAGQVAVVALASITRIADVKPAPGGLERGDP